MKSSAVSRRAVPFFEPLTCREDVALYPSLRSLAESFRRLNRIVRSLLRPYPPYGGCGCERSVAGDEGMTHTVQCRRRRRARIPETRIVELACKLEPRDLLQQAVKVMVCFVIVGRHRRVKEEPLADLSTRPKKF
jgi:hypothetical protein